MNELHAVVVGKLGRVAVLLACGGALFAQVPPRQGQGQGTAGQGQTQAGQPPIEQGPFPGTGTGFDNMGRSLQSPRVLVPQQMEDRQIPLDELDPVWGRPLQQPAFRGFPTFSSTLFGAYPTGQPRGGGIGRIVPRLPLAEEMDGWPSWVKTRGREALPHSPELALLVRHSDRVWHRASSQEPFVPLYHFDKLGTMSSGGEVQVRQTGEFELLFHQSGRLVSTGPCELRVVSMNETSVSIELDWFTAVRMFSAVREHRVHLPDGTIVVVPPDPQEGPPPGQSVLVLQRLLEPDGRAGRATIFQGGDRPARVISPHGECLLENGQQCTILLQPRREDGFAAGELRTENCAAVPQGDVLQIMGGEGAAVHWSGATFRPGAGQRLLLDPMQGQPFAPAGPR